MRRLAVRTITRNGELIAYGHPGVTDAQRAAAGRETVAARDRELLEENRRRAVRQGDVALPAGQNLARVWLPRNPAALQGRLGRDDLAVWAEADVLHVLWRGRATAVDVHGGISVRLWPVPGAADLWEASLRVRDLDRAVLSVAVAPHVDGEPSIGVPPAATLTWRGPSAPAAATTSEPAGTLVDRSIASAALGGSRTVTVYRPPGAHGPLPGCVLADGESTRSFAEVLEPAILDGRTPPVVVIGVHNGGDRRAQEYVPGEHRHRFAAHLRFVTDEVLPWAEGDLGVLPHRWIAAGFSDGGAWAIAAGQRRPDLFTGVAAFSAGVVPRRVSAASRGVRHYLAAGSLDDGFRDATSGWADRLASAGMDVRYDEWTGGHDGLWWRDRFPTAVAHLIG